jgi:hypothetical protein
MDMFIRVAAAPTSQMVYIRRTESSERSNDALESFLLVRTYQCKSEPFWREFYLIYICSEQDQHLTMRCSEWLLTLIVRLDLSQSENPLCDFVGSVPAIADLESLGA